MEAAKQYGQAVRAAGKKHGLGPPHVHICSAMLREMYEALDGDTGSTTEKTAKGVIREYIEATTGKIGPQIIQETVLSWKVNEAYKRDDLDESEHKGKLQYTLNPLPTLVPHLMSQEPGEAVLTMARGYSPTKLKEALTTAILVLNGVKGQGAAPKSALERAVEASLRRR
eukprot:476295-Pyramimonas_sp.AAC.1